jgi:alpha-D-xyloside xylohydrolase
MKKNIFLLIAVFCCSQVQSYEQTTPYGIRATIDSTDIEIRFYSPETVRIIKSPSGIPFRKESFSVVKQPETTPLEYTRTGNILQLKSRSLIVSFNFLTGSLAFFDLDSRPLLTEKDRYHTSSPCEQTFLLEEQEAIYGLGQQQDGFMNRRGQSVFLVQENTKIAIPFFQSVKGYGLFWDNYSATRFTDDSTGTAFSSEKGDAVDYYFLYGKSMDGTVACMRDLTGQAPLFPLWTWGYWQSRERYTSGQELVGTVRRYRDLKIPLDGIIQDWQYWSTDNAYWNALEFGNPEFPDPPQMIKDIHQLHAHTIFSVWPSFGPKTKPYHRLKEKGLLLDFESFPAEDSVLVYDAFHPEARAIYWDFMNKNLFSIGIDGWWLDATEAEYIRITENQMDQAVGSSIFRNVRNAFPLLSIRGVYENERKVSEEKRVYILTRSAFAGQQRYASTSWSGDIDGDWETFRKQIPAGLNFSLCAIPYWNTDIGGFWVRDNSSANADYRELYVRWLQFGAFTPMMRSHGTNTPREIWQFGQKGDWAYDAIEKYIRLRYRLLPYHYSLSWEVSARSGSIMRMLSMDFPQDKKVHDMGTEYLYGRSILVVPVTQAFYSKGEKANSSIDFSRTQTCPVYLPRGTDWYDFWTEEKLSGGSDLLRETPVDIIPLYIKAGSILPLGENVQYASESNWENLELRIYPGADAEFVLYEDERDNYNYEKGYCSTIQFKWDDSAHTLTVGNRLGEFPGMLEKRNFRVTVVGHESVKNIPDKGQSLSEKL